MGTHRRRGGGKQNKTKKNIFNSQIRRPRVRGEHRTQLHRAMLGRQPQLVRVLYGLSFSRRKSTQDVRARHAKRSARPVFRFSLFGVCGCTLHCLVLPSRTLLLELRSEASVPVSDPRVC